MPEAIKEGGGAGDVAAPEDSVPPPVDLATDGAVEVKPPPANEPSLPVDQIQPKEDNNKMEEIGATAPEVKEPPTEQSGTDKTECTTSAEAVSEINPPEPNPKEELDEIITKGRALLTIKRDCYAAAEVLSKACEKASEIYGELSEHCAELYYLYGCSMLECGKSENNVLGEGMKDKDTEDGADEDEGEEEDGEEVGEENKDDKDEAMEVDDTVDDPSTVVGTSNGSTVKDSKEGDEDVTKDDEDDDSSLKVAWEMFELAKVAYLRLDNKEKLADTFMKLGEVGIESGHPSAVEDMLAALDIRQKIFPNKRIIPETHFNIGLGYSMFEMFDEAITHFEKSKSLLEEMATSLQNQGDDQSVNEAKEIKDILPDLKEKIQDMVDSKRDKRREMEEALKNGICSAAKENGSLVPGTSKDTDKPASNITHLIKRKRKIDEVTSDLPNKAVEEPKRKVKALEKEAGEETPDEKKLTSGSENSLEETNKSESQAQEEPMETEEVKDTLTSEEAVNSSASFKSESNLPLLSEADKLECDQKVNEGVAAVSTTAIPATTKLEKREEISSTKDLSENKGQNSDVNNLEENKGSLDTVSAKLTSEGNDLKTVNKKDSSCLDIRKENTEVTISGDSNTKSDENKPSVSDEDIKIKNDCDTPLINNKNDLPNLIGQTASSKEQAPGEVDYTAPSKSNDSNESSVANLVTADSEEMHIDSVNMENFNKKSGETDSAKSGDPGESSENESNRLETPPIAEPAGERGDVVTDKQLKDKNSQETISEGASRKSVTDETTKEVVKQDISKSTEDKKDVTKDVSDSKEAEVEMEVVDKKETIEHTQTPTTIVDKEIISPPIEMEIAETSSTVISSEKESGSVVIDKQENSGDEKAISGPVESATDESIELKSPEVLNSQEVTKDEVPDTQKHSNHEAMDATPAEDIQKETDSPNIDILSEVDKAKSESVDMDVADVKTEVDNKKTLLVETKLKGAVDEDLMCTGDSEKSDQKKPEVKEAGSGKNEIDEPKDLENVTKNASECKKAEETVSAIASESPVTSGQEESQKETSESPAVPHKSLEEEKTVKKTEETSDTNLSETPSEPKKVTNGCAEEVAIEEVKTDVESVTPKEVIKESEEPTPVAAE